MVTQQKTIGSTGKPLRLKIPDAAQVALVGSNVTITGPKGELSLVMNKNITAIVEDGSFVLARNQDTKDMKAMHGLMQALLRNMIIGVTEGYTKTLELSGVGFRALVVGDELTLSVGFSHRVKLKAPIGITFVAADGKIKVSGIDKHLVGQIAHNVRAVRPPEPYKGKGIKYEGEKIRRKAGKAAAKAMGGSK